jgi:hypothetical protein
MKLNPQDLEKIADLPLTIAFPTLPECERARWRLTRFARRAHALPQRPLRTLGKRGSGRRTRPDAPA